MEFARKHWGNRAYRSMLDAVFCNPMFELCDHEHAVGAKLSTYRIEFSISQSCGVHTGTMVVFGLFLTSEEPKVYYRTVWVWN